MADIFYEITQSLISAAFSFVAAAIVVHFTNTRHEKSLNFKAWDKAFDLKLKTYSQLIVLLTDPRSKDLDYDHFLSLSAYAVLLSDDEAHNAMSAVTQHISDRRSPEFTDALHALISAFSSELRFDSYLAITKKKYRNYRNTNRNNNGS